MSPRQQKRQRTEQQPLLVAAAAPVVAAAPIVAETVVTAPLALEYGNRAEVRAKGGQGKVSISELLFNLSRANRLRQGKWNGIHVTKNEYKEPSLVKNTLELCQFVCNAAEVTSIRNGKSMVAEELRQLTHSIEGRAFLKMWELEGKDPVAENLNNQRKGSKKKEPTYQGVGVRVRNYKKAVGDHLGTPPAMCTSMDLHDRPPDMT